VKHLVGVTRHKRRKPELRNLKPVDVLVHQCLNVSQIASTMSMTLTAVGRPHSVKEAIMKCMMVKAIHPLHPALSFDGEFWKERGGIAPPTAWPSPCLYSRVANATELSSAVHVFAFDQYRAHASSTSPDRSRPFAMIFALTDRKAQVL